MPRLRKPRHMYHVYLVRYSSEVARRSLEYGEPYHSDEPFMTLESWDALGSSVFDERAAAVHFYRFCRDAMADPLANRVVVDHGEERVVVWIHPPDLRR